MNNHLEFEQHIKSGERCEEQYRDSQGKLCYMTITKDRFRDAYYLLDVRSGKRKEIAKGSSPMDFRDKVEI